MAKKGFDMLTGSPSRVFCKIGKQLPQSLAQGIRDGSKAPVDAVDEMGTNVANTLSKSLDWVSQSMSVIKDINPTITPVVDLTYVNRAADVLQKMRENNEFGRLVKERADYIGSQMQTRTNPGSIKWEDDRWIDPTDERYRIEEQAVREIKFEQTINSPTALSTSDIYRNTKAQLALAKEELKAS
jgi:hypothetical protein